MQPEPEKPTLVYASHFYRAAVNPQRTLYTGIKHSSIHVKRTHQQRTLRRQEKRMIVKIKPQRNVSIFIACATIGLLPATGSAKPKPITPVELLETILPGEPWDRSVFSSTKTVMFQQAASGGTDSTTVAKITMSYFTSANCSGSVAGSGSYTTPDGPSFTISIGTPFGLVAASTWNVGSTLLSIADMTTIQSVAVTLKSTNNNTPQANFSDNSFACVPVTCTAGPLGQCTSASGTQSFQLKTSAAIGDPANGGVIACLDGGLNNLVAGRLDSATSFSPGIVWGDVGMEIGAQSTTDGAANTTAIVTAMGAGTTYAAGLCQAYPTTVATGGYNTWFLPAKDQLNCLYTNHVAIGNFTTFYWTSNEYPLDPSIQAEAQNLDNGGPASGAKSAPLGARCVQAFTP